MGYARVIGKDRVAALFKKLTAEIEADLNAQLETEAEDLAQAIRRAVPERTGALLRSIRVEKDPEKRLKYWVKVGGVPGTRKKVRAGVRDDDFRRAQQSGGFKGEFDYTLAVEFGHLTEDGRSVPAQPFAYGTARSRKKAAKHRLAASVRKAVAKYDTRSSKG